MELSDKTTEEHVLALIMSGSKELVSDVFARVSPDDFYYEPYRQVFTYLYGRYISGEETTIFAISQKHQSDFESLNKKCPTSLIEIGTGFKNTNYAAEMLDKSEDTVGVLADRLAEKRHMRDLKEIQVRIADGLAKDEETAKTYEAIETLLLKNHTSSSNRSYLSPKEMGLLMLEATDKRRDEEKRDKEIIYTSYEKFNRFSGGLEKGNLVILSAGSGVGKSAFAINIVRDVGFVAGKSVLYLNSEMTNEQQARRYASLLGKVSHHDIRCGEVTEEQYNRILKAADDFSEKQIHTITIPDMQLTHVIAEIKRMKTKADIELAVVDYIGRMDITKAFSKDMQEWQVMEQTARELKNLALELDIVIIMVAQLSSNGQSLAKSSSMKNEADLWINLKRVDKDDYKEYYDANGVGIDDWWNIILEFRKARSAEFGSKLLMHFFGDELLFTDNEDEAKRFTRLEKQGG